MFQNVHIHQLCSLLEETPNIYNTSVHILYLFFVPTTTQNVSKHCIHLNSLQGDCCSDSTCLLTYSLWQHTVQQLVECLSGRMMTNIIKSEQMAMELGP